MKRFVVVSTAVGFLVPIVWGIVGFLTFTAPQSPSADMFWTTVHETCPPWLIDESSIFGRSIATPFLNAALYGGAACIVALLVLSIAWGTPIRVSSRLKPAILVLGLAGAGAAFPIVFTEQVPWSLMALPIGAWTVIGSMIAYFSIPGGIWESSRQVLPAGVQTTPTDSAKPATLQRRFRRSPVVRVMLILIVAPIAIILILRVAAFIAMMVTGQGRTSPQ